MQLKLLLAALGALSTVACASRTQPAVSRLAAANGVDQTSNDTATLSAAFGADVSVSGGQGSLRLDLGRCQRLPDSTAQELHADCTLAAQALAGAPMVMPVQLYATSNGSGGFNSEFWCRFVALRTVTKDSALASPVFAGIGFYSSLGGGASLTVAKDRLLADGAATLKSGEAATIHRFAGIGGCWEGDSSASEEFMTYFKAYAAFNTGATSYKNWESAAADHGIGYRFPGFDRTSELLK